MRSCPHRSAVGTQGRARCGLLGIVVSPATCARCVSEWQAVDIPPTVNTLTPTVVALAETHGRTPKESPEGKTAEPRRQDRRTPKSRPLRRPPQCDHAGRRIKPGPTCTTSVYACDIHGQATCGPAQSGVTRCQECGDFEAAESVTTH